MSSKWRTVENLIGILQRAQAGDSATRARILLESPWAGVFVYHVGTDPVKLEAVIRSLRREALEMELDLALSDTPPEGE